MQSGYLRIGIISTGSQTQGNLERNVCRLAQDLQSQGFETVVMAPPTWPAELEHFSTAVVRTGSYRGPLEFADQVAELQPRQHCDLLVSLERVWDCDVYWARQGVHLARIDHWQRHARSARGRSREYPKEWDEAYLKLEAELFSPKASRQVIACSERVRYEIAHYHECRPKDVPVVYDGYKKRSAVTSSASAAHLRQLVGIADDELMLLAEFDAGEPGLTYAEAVGRRVRRKGMRLVICGSAPKPWLPLGGAIDVGQRYDRALLYEAADLFLYPAVYAPSSERTMAAIAHGTPVLTTTTNAATEVHRMRAIEDPSDVPLMVERLKRWGEKHRPAQAISNPFAPKRFSETMVARIQALTGGSMEVCHA